MLHISHFYRCLLAIVCLMLLLLRSIKTSPACFNGSHLLLLPFLVFKQYFLFFSKKCREHKIIFGANMLRKTV